MLQVPSTCFAPQLDYSSVTPYEFLMEKLVIETSVSITKDDTVRLFKTFIQKMDVLDGPSEWSRLAAITTAELANIELTNFNNVLLSYQYIGHSIEPVYKPTPFVFEAVMQKALVTFLTSTGMSLTDLFRQHMMIRFATIPGLFRRATEVSWQKK